MFFVMALTSMITHVLLFLLSCQIREGSIPATDLGKARAKHAGSSPVLAPPAGRCHRVSACAAEAFADHGSPESSQTATEHSPSLDTNSVEEKQFYSFNPQPPTTMKFLIKDLKPDEISQKLK